MAYATAADLAAYLGKEPPQDANRLLERASEVIDSALGYLVEPDPEALKLATCQQVEFWLEVGEAHDIAGVSGAISVDRLSYTAPPVLAPRARRTLLAAGLLYRGVGLK